MNLSYEAQQIALAIWREQIDQGISEPGEIALEEHLDEWLMNRTYPASTLEDAANGDVSAIAEVRSEAGLPILS